MKTAQGRSTNGFIGKFSFKILQNSTEKVNKLLSSSHPAFTTEIGLVPDLPDGDIHVKTVRPSIVVVANDSGENFGVLLKISRHPGIEMMVVKRVLNTCS